MVSVLSNGIPPRPDAAWAVAHLPAAEGADVEVALELLLVVGVVIADRTARVVLDEA